LVYQIGAVIRSAGYNNAFLENSSAALTPIRQSEVVAQNDVVSTRVQ
jgi:hypothetical protein